FDELAGQREAEAGALHAAALPDLAELLEHRRVILGGDAHAGVAHRDQARPPSGVNLSAFDSRFRSTCFTLRSSAWIIPSAGSTTRSSAIPRRLARSR